MNVKKQPDKTYQVGGREFQLYREYDDICEQEILIYPDFTEKPEYTDEGYPFTISMKEGCIHFASESSDENTYKDCGLCKWFHNGGVQNAAIGICTCAVLTKGNSG